MVTLKNGCKARNLQEQVAYNAEEIERLKHLIGDTYLEIDDTALTHTGTITSDMKKVLDAYEIVYVILKQATDLYQVFRTDYYEQKFRKSAIFVGGSLHKLDLDYDNSTWSYSEQSIGGVQVQSDWNQTDTTQVDYIKNKPAVIKELGNEAISGQPYHFPYTIENLRFDSVDNKIKAQLFTITLDNNKTLVQYPLEVSLPLDTKQNLIQNVILTGTSGTLTDAQLATLQASQCNYILVKSGTNPDFVYEKYDLMDNKTADGYLAYSHVEKESTSYKAKTITITISTGAYVQVEQELPLIKVNETLAGTETVLSELTRNNTKYKVEHTTETVLYEDTNIVLNYEKASASNVQYSLKPDGVNRYKLEEFDYIVILYVFASTDADSIKMLISEEMKMTGDSSNSYISTETSYDNSSAGTIRIYHRTLILKNDHFQINGEVSDIITSTGPTTTSENKRIIPYKILGYKYS